MKNISHISPASPEGRENDSVSLHEPLFVHAAGDAETRAAVQLVMSNGTDPLVAKHAEDDQEMNYTDHELERVLDLTGKNMERRLHPTERAMMGDILLSLSVYGNGKGGCTLRQLKDEFWKVFNSSAVKGQKSSQ